MVSDRIKEINADFPRRILFNAMGVSRLELLSHGRNLNQFILSLRCVMLRCDADIDYFLPHATQRIPSLLSWIHMNAKRFYNSERWVAAFPFRLYATAQQKKKKKKKYSGRALADDQ